MAARQREGVPIPNLFGREYELDSARTFLGWIPTGPVALVLEGEAGIGKTSLLKDTVGAAQARSWPVLTAQPTSSETGLPFAALADLLSGLAPQALDALPGPQRRALDVVLLRADPDAAVPDSRALATGFVSILTALARRSPLVVAVDDVQWLDKPSARVVQFAIRRLADLPVGIIACTRSPEQTSIRLGLNRALPEDRVCHLRLGPLPLAALEQMIADRIQARFPRRTLMRIAETSAGNPFFTLEIARALHATGRQAVPGQELPIPPSLAELVAERVGALPVESQALLSAVSATANPTLELIEALAGPSGAADALAQAEAAGIVEVEGLRVRFSHPLLAAVVWSSTPPSARRRIHRRLAQLVTEPEESARHLAAIAGAPDEEVAAILTAAARRARARGAPDAAAEMYEHSVSLTPETHPRRIWRRFIDAADCHVESGDDRRARQLLQEVVATAPAGPLRAEALLQLGNIGYRLDDVFSAIGLLERALEESADDVALRSAIERRLGYLVTVSGDLIGGLSHARAALSLLEGSTDRAAVLEAVAHVTMTEFLLGHGWSPERMERELASEDKTAYPLPMESRPTLIYGLILLWTDEPDAARAVVEKVHRRLSEEGDENGIPYTSWVLSWVELATGSLDRAASYIEEAMPLAESSGQALIESMLLSAAAQLYAWKGEVGRARAAAEAGLDLSMQAGLASAVAFNTAALGFLELSLGDAAAAHRCLGSMADFHLNVGIGEPGVLRFVPDEIEALVALGELQRAAALLEPFEAKAHALGRTWAIAVAARCRALLTAAEGDVEAALGPVDDAVRAQRQLPNPLELGRTLVLKGRVHRRRKEKRAAREALEEALAIFERLGAPLWAERAAAELARLGGRPPAPMELTATEQRVAELAAAGLTNRRAAEAVFMTPKSVEGVLARVYRKLGVRSRAELGATMAARRAASGPDARPVD